MILLIDNYDSFSYNLVQLIGSILLEDAKSQDKDIISQIRILRNDELTIKEVEELSPSHIVLSPGPGRPKDAGICEDLVLHMKGKAAILGVCLGHQGICEAFGTTITYAKELMHGKQSDVHLDNKYSIFFNISDVIKVGRYHSLAVDKTTLPNELQVIAMATDGEVMAIKHKEYEIYGLQFHPESVLTPDGKEIIRNFLSIQQE